MTDVRVSMSMTRGSVSLAVVIVASCMFASGGALMKVSDGLSRLWPSLGALSLFVGGAFLLARTLRTEGLATVWLIGLGVEAVVSIALGLLLFSEQLSSFQIAGMALIVGGTVLTELA